MIKKRNACFSGPTSSYPSSRRNRNRPENPDPYLEWWTTGDFNRDDDGDSDISYESDHTECNGSGRNVNNSSTSSILKWFQNSSLWVRYTLIILLVSCVFVGLNYSFSSSNSESVSLKRYKQRINGILKKNFTSEYKHDTNTKAVLRLIGEKWVYQKPVEPYVVLIAGTKADMLADALGDVFSNVTGKGEIDRIFCNEYKERQLLESEVTKALSRDSKSVVLHGIDKLRGHAPLYLHSLSDSDHSPFRSALILLTINLFFGSHPGCEDMISSHLLNMWSSDYIGEDQIRPILSRISSFLICLED